MCIGTNNVYVIGKMIHKFCYSHLIMINTLYTCTVQVRVLYTVQYRVYHYFLLGSILLGGGLSPPSPNDAPPLLTSSITKKCVLSQVFYILFNLELTRIFENFLVIFKKLNKYICYMQSYIRMNDIIY